jgi:hypothetical protein
MAVEFDCPECGRRARIVTGGYVEAHEASAGVVCSFTRTARSGERPTFVEPTPETVARIAALREQREAAKLERAERRRRAQAKEPGSTSPRGKMVCPRCDALVARSQASSTRLVAHKRPSGHWCKGGAEPTAKQRAKTQKRRSVRTVSGGLPSLGKRG